MFHDEYTPPNERPKLVDLSSRLSEAVRTCLSMYRCVVDEVVKLVTETNADILSTPLLLLYDYAESIDGICLLAERGSARNCPQLLRTALEVQLGILYMLQAGEDNRLRCLAYDYFHHKEELGWAQKRDPDHQRGKQLRAEVRGHHFAHVFDSDTEEAKLVTVEREQILASDLFKEVRAEIERMKREGEKPTEWYSLWNGPKNVRELAKRLTVLPMYEVLYRIWSGPTHGGAALGRIRGVKVGQTEVMPVRSPSRLHVICLHAAMLTNGLSMFLVSRLVPYLQADVEKHFEKLVRPALATIQSIQIDGSTIR